jgi:primosomal protein N' (replication factor Y)
MLFTYSYNENVDVQGFRVLVPFGKKEQLLQGIVLYEDLELIKNETTIHKIKPIVELLDTTPCFSSNMLKFISWMADYYHAPIGETFKIAIPAGISPKSLIKIFPNRDKSESELQAIYQQNPIR